MARKKQNKFLTGTIAIIILLIAGTAAFMLTQGSIYGQPDYQNLYTPEWSSIWCGQCEGGETSYNGNVNSVNIGYWGGTGALDQKSFYCGVENLPGTFKTDGCKYFLNGVGAYRVCPENSDCKLISNTLTNTFSYKDLGELKPGTTNQINFGERKLVTENIVGSPSIFLSPGEKLQVGADAGFDVRVQAYAQPFCLKKLIRGAFYPKIVNNGCDKSKLAGIVLGGKQPVTSIVGATAEQQYIAHSAQEVDYTLTGFEKLLPPLGKDGVPMDVNVNDGVYLMRSQTMAGAPIVACAIKVASGYTYVDTLDCTRNEKYICLPSEPSWSNGEGKSCIGGTEVVTNKIGTKCVTNQWVTTPNKEKCVIPCINGVQGNATCEKIVAPEQPTGEREIITQPDEGFPWGIVLIVVLIFGFMMIALLMMQQRNNTPPQVGGY